MAAAKRTPAEEASAVLAKIAGWPEQYRVMGERLHTVVLEAAPALSPKLWYGMPGYAKGSGPVLVHFLAEKYMSFGITEKAHVAVQDGAPDQLVPSGWFLSTLDEATERRIAEIVRRAVG